MGFLSPGTFYILDQNYHSKLDVSYLISPSEAFYLSWIMSIVSALQFCSALQNRRFLKMFIFSFIWYSSYPLWWLYVGLNSGPHTYMKRFLSHCLSPVLCFCNKDRWWVYSHDNICHLYIVPEQVHLKFLHF